MRTCLLATVLGLTLPASATLAADTSPSWRKDVPQKSGMQAFEFPLGALGDGKQFSIQIHLRAGALTPGTLLHTSAAGGQEPIELAVEDGGRYGRLIEFRVTTDFRPKPLMVGFPVALLARDMPHELLLRDLGFRLDFFVDGFLADQEWPIGRVATTGRQQVQASSSIRDVQVWPFAVPDTTVEQMSGGHEAVAKRDLRLLGPLTGPMQYFRPRGYNTSAGDAMPFLHDGVLHVFYLLDRRHHQSKWGLGAHQWAHVSTTDLVHWKNYPMALTIEREGEASICTGSVFFNGGKYYAFYATRLQDRSEHLGMAVSDDGVHFQKLLPSPFAGPDRPYRTGPTRDPFVFGEPGDFHMTVTASLAAPESPDRAGALEHLTSPDLKTWKVESSPFLVTGYAADPECSDLFFWHSWYYLLFSEGDQAHYRMSRSSSGPWIKPAVDVFDGIEARVMKTAPFNGDRRIGVAFVPDGDFGGHLLFRELIQEPDGTLHTTFLNEMMPPGVAVAEPTIEGEHGATKAIITLQAKDQPAQTSISVPKNFILKATLSPSEAASAFGFRFNPDSATAASHLEFSPAKDDVRWIGNPSPAGALPFIDGVKDLDSPIELQLIAKGTIIDVSINGRHTLVHRLPAFVGEQIVVFTNSGRLTVTDLAIKSIEGGE